LSQLFYTLIDNSLKHGKKVTKIDLSFSKDETGRIKVLYKDNGVGIPTENKKRIFYGYTTGGTGLGLRLVTKMIETYGWTIKEKGVPDKGAIFEFLIPRKADITLIF
jgi:signal transduction histidine kinase